MEETRKEENREEKKKLLLVAVSVGVFLVIVVSAAIMVFFKDGSGSQAAVSSVNSTMPSYTTDASNMVNNENLRGLQSPTSISPIQENYINIYGESSSMTVDSQGGTSNTRTVIVPPPKAPAIPEVKPAPVKPVVVAPAPPQQKPAPAAQVKQTAPAAVKKTYKDFWVQAGSFSTRERADGVKSTLGDKGISAIVTNQNINGSTYYRVRIGPYTSQNEADYWLAMIKSIDGFQDSQIWESQSYR